MKRMRAMIQSSVKLVVGSTDLPVIPLWLVAPELHRLSLYLTVSVVLSVELNVRNCLHYEILSGCPHFIYYGCMASHPNDFDQWSTRALVLSAFGVAHSESSTPWRLLPHILLPSPGWVLCIDDLEMEKLTMLSAFLSSHKGLLRMEVGVEWKL